MANFVEVVTKYIRPYYYYILIAVLLIVFIYASNYAYNTYYLKNTRNKYANVANSDRRQKEVSVLFFHVDWCPHCKKALPEWNKFKSQYNDKEVNGYVVKCVDMDCTTESSDIARAIRTYNIESYPTIKMLKEEKTIEFDSKITNGSLEQFVMTMLNE